jgi:uncharacterized membrane protein
MKTKKQYILRHKTKLELEQEARANQACIATMLAVGFAVTLVAILHYGFGIQF